ncbi:DUF6894 family protein [Microvirga pudoricolor]|uniref:DUF6894 family protein n=1 Tax=Microvirga pudoricolor TaxID=2778729 RepID=UPI0019512DFA|nr:hypothetical protein [Microvirga pudoricolor]MBM6595074.1 hypothetical protein [Microvirga pudoricolor]
MTWFYFDVRNGIWFAPDTEGSELASLGEAEREAARCAADFEQDLLPEGSTRGVTVEVKNEHYQRMLTVTVTLTVHQVALEPVTLPTSIYRDRARSTRLVADWTSNQIDRAQLLRRAEHCDALAQTEEHERQDQGVSHAPEVRP